MAKKQGKKDSQIKLESLLKIKRHEKPNSDFWLEFEKGLESKQLSLLVKRQPLAQRVHNSFMKLLTNSLPLTGAAAFILTIFFTQGWLDHNYTTSQAAHTKRNGESIKPTVSNFTANTQAISNSASIPVGAQIAPSNKLSSDKQHNVQYVASPLKSYSKPHYKRLAPGYGIY